MVVSNDQMRWLEEQAFARGVLAESLMEQAGRGIASVIRQWLPQEDSFAPPIHLLLVLGKGNNAGDAMVTARELAQQPGCQLYVRLVDELDEFKPLPSKHWQALKDRVQVVPNCLDLEHLHGVLIILDGLLGIGAKGRVRDRMAEAIFEVNQLRQRRHAMVVAMDLPSGLEGKLAESDSDGACIQADLTVTIGMVKSVLLCDEAIHSVGRLALVQLPELNTEMLQLSQKNCMGQEVLFAPQLLPKLTNRDYNFHKGQAGRLGIVAGAKGTLGAAILAARGALAGGAGLITIYAKPEVYDYLAVMMPEEVMVKEMADLEEVLKDRLDSLVIGPGIGRHNQPEILKLIDQSQTPMVIDADGLNAISEHGVDVILDGLQAPTLLTPHPGEMLRLIQDRKDWQGLDRASLASAFTDRFPKCTLLLKGARTVIAQQGRDLSFNSTGSPGMASGGMGDVLSGLAGALLAGGMAAYEAACLGAWLSGRAAELAILKNAASQESLTASTMADHIGHAFASLKRLDA